jgi:hypothetical protein
VSLPTAVGLKRTLSVTATPGFKVTGNVAPDRVKFVPETATELTVTGEVPAELSFTDSVSDWESGTLPKARLVVLTVSLALDVAAPVPLRLTLVVGALAELVLIVKVPLSGTAAGGVNLTVRTRVLPGFRVTGRPCPDRANPTPVTDADLMVNAAVPAEVNVTVLVAAELTFTLPNARAVEFIDTAGVAAATAFVLAWIAKDAAEEVDSAVGVGCANVA